MFTLRPITEEVVEVEDEERQPRLTPRGRRTLKRGLESRAMRAVGLARRLHRWITGGRGRAQAHAGERFGTGALEIRLGQEFWFCC